MFVWSPCKTSRPQTTSSEKIVTAREKFRSRRWGSSQPGLRSLNPPLEPHHHKGIRGVPQIFFDIPIFNGLPFNLIQHICFLIFQLTVQIECLLSIISYFPSVSSPVYLYFPSIQIVLSCVKLCPFVSTSVHLCPPLSTCISLCPHVTPCVKLHPLVSTSVHFCLFVYTNVHVSVCVH